jgi:hypothetical protein
MSKDQLVINDAQCSHCGQSKGQCNCPTSNADAFEDSFRAARWTLGTSHKEANKAALAALGAAHVGDNEDAARLHTECAAMHDDEAQHRADEGDGEGFKRHKRAAGFHGKAAAAWATAAKTPTTEESDMVDNSLPIPPTLNWRAVVAEQRRRDHRVRNVKAGGSNADIGPEQGGYGMDKFYNESGQQIDGDRGDEPGDDWAGRSDGREDHQGLDRAIPAPAPTEEEDQVRGAPGFMPVSGSGTDAIQEGNRRRLNEGTSSSYYGSDDRRGTGSTEGWESCEQPDTTVAPPDNSSARRSARLTRGGQPNKDYPAGGQYVGGGSPAPARNAYVYCDADEWRRERGLPIPGEGTGTLVANRVDTDTLPIPPTTEDMIANLDQYGRPRR